MILQPLANVIQRIMDVVSYFYKVALINMKNVIGNIVPVIIYLIIGMIVKGDQKILFPSIMIFMVVWTYYNSKKSLGFLKNVASTSSLLLLLFVLSFFFTDIYEILVVAYIFGTLLCGALGTLIYLNVTHTEAPKDSYR